MSPRAEHGFSCQIRLYRAPCHLEAREGSHILPALIGVAAFSMTDMM